MIANEPSPDGAAGGGWRAASLLAVAAGLAVTLFCAAVIYRTAQLPAGDGTGMQWIVLTPLALLFLLVGLPALIIGLSGLGRDPTAAQRGRRRAFRLLFGLLAVVLVVLFVVPLAVGLLLGEG